jgi:hypothetical protein
LSHVTLWLARRASILRTTLIAAADESCAIISIAAIRATTSGSTRISLAPLIASLTAPVLRRHSLRHWTLITAAAATAATTTTATTRAAATATAALVVTETSGYAKWRFCGQFKR